MAWGFDPVTGQWSTNPHVTTSALQGYQPGGALPAGFLEQMRQMYANGQGGEYTDPATGYTFAPNLTDGRFNGGTLYQIQGKGDYTTPGYVYDASGRPTDPGFQIEHKAPSFMDNYGWMVPLALAGGAAAMGLGSGAGGAAGAAGGSTGGAVGSGAGFVGEGVASGVPAWDAAAGASMSGAAGFTPTAWTASGAPVWGVVDPAFTGATLPATSMGSGALSFGGATAGGALGANAVSGAGGASGGGVPPPANPYAYSGAAGGIGSALGNASGGFDWTKLIGPGLSAVGGIAGANAAKSAAEVQAQSARDAQAKLEPWYQAGGNALARLQEELGLGPNTGSANYGRSARDFTMADYQADPGLEFRRQQGEQGLMRAASASGGLGSGKFLKDAMSFNSGLASQEYGNAFNRFQTSRTNRLNPLQSLAGQGQSTAQMVGDLSTQAGNAQAAGKVGSANALTNAIGQGWSMYQNSQQQDQNNSLMNLLLRRGA